MKLIRTLLSSAILASVVSAAAAHPSLTFQDIFRLEQRQDQDGLAPIVRIVSPLNGDTVASGDGRIGAGNTNGTGFAVNLEVVTRDHTKLTVREATMAPPIFGIRHTTQLASGQPNPDFPGLYLFFDTDLVTPDGTILPRGTNFASAFNVAGSDDTPGKGMTLWAGWHVLESLPRGVKDVKMTVAVVDDAGRIGTDRIVIHANEQLGSGQALTPLAESYTGGAGVDDPNGPEVSMIAPRVPTSIAVGPSDNSLTANNGSLFFIQVTAVDRHHAGIAVNETGVRPSSTFPAGLIFDPPQIPNTTLQNPAGSNRNYPGLAVTFDVPLRQPNGNIVPAGVNLAPLFDIVGSEVDTASGATRVTADWVVGGSLVIPTGKQTVTVTSAVTDNAGKRGLTRSILAISPTASGQDLTLNP